MSSLFSKAEVHPSKWTLVLFNLYQVFEDWELTHQKKTNKKNLWDQFSVLPKGTLIVPQIIGIKLLTFGLPLLSWSQGSHESHGIHVLRDTFNSWISRTLHRPAEQSIDRKLTIEHNDLRTGHYAFAALKVCIKNECSPSEVLYSPVTLD